MDAIEKLLKELTEAGGVPGYEDEVRGIIRGHFEPLGENVQDKIGSLICWEKGGAGGPKVVIGGHLDEVGFMVKLITKEGFIRFTALGGWWDQVLLAHRVIIKTRKGDVTGVIGAKPPHILTEEDRKKVVEKKDMYIDIGATSQQEVEEAGVCIGDPVIPLSQFSTLSVPGTYLAKALDNRLGCALVISVMQELANESHPNRLIGIATVQEEVGLRGAVTSVHMIDPDVAIITETGIAGDVPGIKPEESTVKLGGGPVLFIYDARMIPNLKLRDMVIDTAKRNDIPLQFTAIEGGATDGGAIHLHKAGVPTVVISVPVRHIHSHNGIFHRTDFDNTVKLLKKVIQELDAETVAGLTAW